MLLCSCILTLVATVIACLNLARVRASLRRIIHTESSGGIRATAKIQSVSNTLCLPMKVQNAFIILFSHLKLRKMSLCKARTSANSALVLSAQSQIQLFKLANPELDACFSGLVVTSLLFWHDVGVPVLPGKLPVPPGINQLVLSLVRMHCLFCT